jgi:hypothetical protein
MSLLKIEEDGGLVGLWDQRGQNESVIWVGGGFGVTHFQPWCGTCTGLKHTKRGHSTHKYARYKAVWSVMWMVATCMSWHGKVT